MDIDFGGDEIVLPAEYLTREAVITVIVIEHGNPEPVIMQDWTLERVKRGKEGDLSTYEAVYSGEAARGYAWKPDSGIYIELCPRKDSGIARTFVYKAEGTKDDWYDYLMVWKGYKAHWYDYAKVWENSVRFVRMK